MTTAELRDLIFNALGRSYSLGQTYWQQADSDFTSQHRKADQTQAKFDHLRASTLADLSEAMNQRDELLAALEGLYEVATIDNDKDYARVTNAAAVIAKARGAQ